MVRFPAFLKSGKPYGKVLCFFKKSRNLMVRFAPFFKSEKTQNKVFEKEIEKTS